jgi:hypothetical protein
MNKRFIAFVIIMLLSDIGMLILYKQKKVRLNQSKTPLEHILPDPPSSTPEPKNPNLPKPIELLPQFVSVAKVRNVNEDGTIYADVISHSKKPFGDESGRSTNVHETTHGINSQITNEHPSNVKINGFYCLQGRGVIVDEPKLKKSYLIKFLPQNLRSYRYNLYIAGQKEWEDVPTYICDEWIAYINGGKCCVDDINRGLHKAKWTDGVSGCLDFSIYTVALCMAIKEHDPDYWKNNIQFRSFVTWQLQEALNTYLAGHQMPMLKWDKQDALLKELLTSSAAEPMRKFIRNELNGIWLNVDSQMLQFITYEPYQTVVLQPQLKKHR